MGIAKKEFHVMHRPREEKMALDEIGKCKIYERNLGMVFELATEEGYGDSNYMTLHWARVTTETPRKVMGIGDIKELVVALIDHGSEINVMSIDFYKKGKWAINMKHGWKI